MEGELRVFEVPFGSGLVLMGHHEKIRFSNPLFAEAALHWRNNSIVQSSSRDTAVSLASSGALQLRDVSSDHGPARPDLLAPEEPSLKVEATLRDEPNN